jgi:hypothetical protein
VCFPLQYPTRQHHLDACYLFLKTIHHNLSISLNPLSTALDGPYFKAALSLLLTLIHKPAQYCKLAQHDTLRCRASRAPPG